MIANGWFLDQLDWGGLDQYHANEVFGIPDIFLKLDHLHYYLYLSPYPDRLLISILERESKVEREVLRNSE